MGSDLADGHGNYSSMALDPSGRRLYVADRREPLLWVIDTASDSVIANVPMGGHGSGVALTPDGSRIYVANFDNDTVEVIEASSNSVVTTVPVGHEPVALGQFVGPGVIGTSPTPTARSTSTSSPTPTLPPTQTATPHPTPTRGPHGGGGCSMVSSLPHETAGSWLLAAVVLLWRWRAR